MSTIYYTKLFTSGILTGISLITSVTFDAKLTDEYVKWIVAHTKSPIESSGSRFVITDFSFQNYAR